MTLPDHNLDSLTDEELIALRKLFRRFCDVATVEAMRAITACLNEVDARLANRGRLDLRTRVIT